MSEELYILQALLIGAVILVMFRQHPRLVQMQILVWTLGVTGIAWRFGLVEQLNFYSNDQRYYQIVVERLLTERTLVSEAYPIEGSKIPYTGSALLLAFAGVHPALALKTVSLVSILVLASDVLKRYQEQTMRNDLRVLFFSGCGGVGVFFSILALRETMMMLFVYRFATKTSAVNRIVSLAVVYLLRPHLAVALAAGQLLMTMWCWLSRGTNFSQLWSIFFVLIASIVGSTLYSLQEYLRYKSNDFLMGSFGISGATRVASNFVGLQFLTVPEGTVNFSLTSLLLLRLVFSETVLIPLGFTVVYFVFAQEMTVRSQVTLCSFAIYVGIVTKTDFNSFRQNIPFMPLMGVVILDLIRIRRLNQLNLSPGKSDSNSIAHGSGTSKSEIDTTASS